MHNNHHGVIDCFVDLAKRMGKDVTTISENEIDVENIEARRRLCDGVDLVISMGGDHAFLKSQALLWDQTIPIMGINTNRNKWAGALNSHSIDFSSKEEQALKLLEQLDCASSVSFEKRSRILFER